jgi:hypothetical protein
MPEQHLETWEEFGKDLQPPYDIHLRDEGIRNSLHETMAFSTGHNQASISSLNQATIARGEIASDKPYHSTSITYFTGSRVPVPDGTSRRNPTRLLYQFYPDATDNT